nr:hypothetical protein [Tanacetum cinerariifolium]
MSRISIFSFGMIPGTLPEPLKIGKTGRRVRAQPLRSTSRSLTPSSWHTLLTGNSFGIRTDEVGGYGTYTNDEINRLLEGVSSEGTFPVWVGYCQHGPQPAQVRLRMKARSTASTKRSGGCEDDEEGTDDKDDEDEDGDGDT